jgi:hypothetical protein
MADEMEHQVLDNKGEAPESVEDSYKIITYQVTKMPYEFRNVILQPYLTTHRYGNDYAKLIDNDAYFDNYGKYIRNLLFKPTVVVRLAMLSDKTVLGWSLSEGNVLHYVWVKKEVRRKHIGESLVPKGIEFFTHITNYGLAIWAKKYQSWRLNPFL